MTRGRGGSGAEVHKRYTPCLIRIVLQSTAVKLVLILAGMFQTALSLPD